MKKLLLAAVAGMGISTAVNAADLAVKARPAPPPVALYNWTGFYIGGNAGYSWSDSNITYTIGPAVLPLPGSVSHQNLDGFLGGGQIGYNWQNGKFVFGLEADAAWRNSRASTTFTQGLDFATFTTRQNWLATFRPRAGIAANSWLFYVTGGAAVEGLEHSYSEGRPTAPGAFRSLSSDQTRWGWTVGAGVEAGFGQWSAGLEYLYVDFGRNSTLTQPAQVLGGVLFPVTSASFDDSAQHVVRAKLNYRFGGPVVARY